MGRERRYFFNKRAAHFIDPNWFRLGETKNRLPSSRLESQLFRSEFKSQLTVFFFQIPKSSALWAWRHSRPRFNSYLRFLLWHLWLSHPPRARVNTCTQCVQLTNPCTKRKVLSLTNPKGKIYKTKIDNIKKIRPQLYYTGNRPHYWLVNSLWRSRWRVFMEEGETIL